MEALPKAAVIMKVGPHSNMNLQEIIASKKTEETIHGVHYWGYSGSLCRPAPTQSFCKWAREVYGEDPSIILIETKSAYTSTIGYISQYSIDNKQYVNFQAPVQLQGAQFSFVSKNLRTIDAFCLSKYAVYGGKNAGKKLSEHLRYRVNKSFVILNESFQPDEYDRQCEHALIATLVEPYAIWLKE